MMGIVHVNRGEGLKIREPMRAVIRREDTERVHPDFDGLDTVKNGRGSFLSATPQSSDDEKRALPSQSGGNGAKFGYVFCSASKFEIGNVRATFVWRTVRPEPL